MTLSSTHLLPRRARVLCAVITVLCGVHLCGASVRAQGTGASAFGPQSVADERVEIPRGRVTKEFEVDRLRVALGILPGATRPSGSTQSPFPGIAFADVVLDLDLNNWRAVAAHWLAQPGVDWISPVMRGADGGPVVCPREVLIGVEPGRRTDAAWRASLQAIGLAPEPGSFAGTTSFYRCRSAQRDALETLQILRFLTSYPGIRFAEPDAWFSGRAAGRLVAPTTDPLFSLAWGLENTGQAVGSSAAGTPGIDVGAVAANAIETGSPEVVVAILDVGVDLSHPDLHLIVPGTDTTNDPASLGDGAPVNALDRHGTAVAGVAVARADNGIGAAGLSPGCPGLSIRALITVAPNGSWVSQASFTVDGLEFARQNGARVTINSNVYGFQSSAIDAKYAELRDLGIVHTASAGNTGATTVGYPSSLPTVLSVSGIDPSGVLFHQNGLISSTGADVFLTAPAQDVVSTDQQGADGYVAGDYVFVTGTSFSTPFVAAAAALALSLEPDLEAQEVEALLARTARDLGAPGRDNQFGFGLVRADAALQDLEQPVFSGTGGPLELGLGDSSNTLVFGPGAYVEQIRGGDTLVLSLRDPTGAFLTAPCAIAIAPFTSLGPPSQILPGFWFEPNSILIPAAGGLSSAGFELRLNAPLAVPPGRFLAQGIAVLPAANLVPESSWAAEVRIR